MIRIDFSKRWIKLPKISLKRMHLKIPPAECRSFGGLFVFRNCPDGIVNLLRFSDALWAQRSCPLLIQLMACHLFVTKPLPEPILTCYKLNLHEDISIHFYSKLKKIRLMKCIWNCQLQNDGNFVQVSICQCEDRGQSQSAAIKMFWYIPSDVTNSPGAPFTTME